MSNYFSYFPTTQHNVTNIGSSVQLTNILKRFKFRSSVQDNIDVFYEYDIQEGDRPDTIAEKYYGNADYAWIVLHFNDIIDPIFDWALFGRDFDRYIKGKYGSIPTAQNTVHEYRRVIREKSETVTGTIIPEKYVVVDSTSYNSILNTITLTSGGSGYTTTPIVEISSPDIEGGVQATATAIVSGGVVTGITVTNRGYGYLTAPTVNISTGDSAVATAFIDLRTVDGSPANTSTYGTVTSLVLDNIGKNYTTTPTVIISGGGGSGATATATVTNQRVTNITLTAAGASFEEPPTVSINSIGSDATASANVGYQNNNDSVNYIRTVSKYEFEEEQNEKKRKIKILDKRYLNKIRDEVEDILRNNV